MSRASYASAGVSTPSRLARVPLLLHTALTPERCLPARSTDTFVIATLIYASGGEIIAAIVGLEPRAAWVSIGGTFIGTYRVAMLQIW